MLRAKQAQLELAAIPVLAGILDGAATLLGQDPAYFSGSSTPEELNPIGHLLLSASPVYFAGALIAWLIVLALIILSLNHRRASYISLGATGLHIFGISTWVIDLPLGLIWTILLVSVFRFLVYPRYNMANSLAP